MALDSGLLSELLHPDGGTLACDDDQRALAFCERMARTHYENFPVGSLLVEKSRRPFFYAVYAFARMADDVADNDGRTAEQKIALLNAFEQQLLSDDETTHPVFRAMRYTVRNSSIQTHTAQRLLVAFRMDSQFVQPERMDDLLRYCSFSANPVGELLLQLYEENSADNVLLSDDICTALQLINFWQDLSVDMAAKRFYIPHEWLQRFDLDARDLAAEQFSANFPSSIRSMLAELHDETKTLLLRGSELCRRVHNRRLRAELSAIVSGGELLRSKSQALGEGLLQHRPTLSAWDHTRLLLRSLPTVFLPIR